MFMQTFLLYKLKLIIQTKRRPTSVRGEPVKKVAERHAAEQSAEEKSQVKSFK